MKNSINTLPKSLLLCAVLTVSGGSAFAQSKMELSGSVQANTCNLVFAAAATGTATITSLALLTVPAPAQFPATAVGYTTVTSNAADKFYVKVLTTAGAACTGLTSAGAPATNYNFTIAAGNGVTTGGKAVPTVSGTTATNVTIDLVPSAGTKTTTGLDLVAANTTPLSQHGISNTAIVTSGTTTAPFFIPKFYKTSATNAVTSGSVAVSYTFTAQYL